MENPKGSEETRGERDTENYARRDDMNIEYEWSNARETEQIDLTSSRFQILSFKSSLKLLLSIDLLTRNFCT